MQQKFNKTTFRCAIYWVGVNIWGGGGGMGMGIVSGFFFPGALSGTSCMYVYHIWDKILKNGPSKIF